MKNFIFVLAVFFFCSSLAKAQALQPLASTQAVTLTLDSSKLPIVALKLPFLLPANDPIPDTPKVTVGMGIINNGYNVMNHIADFPNGYKGQIGIEKRGSISQAFWFLQKSYGLETRDIGGADSDAVILGMPIEHDWILYGPYDDESLMRNTLIYQLGRDMGYYAPRTKYCEVQFYNWLWQPDYRGVYVMTEKIKRDNNRVNISKLTPLDNSGDAVTGGYIFAVDKNIWANDSGWKSPIDTNVFFSYKYPKGDEITIQQKTYLKAYVDSFETALQGPNFMSPAVGYKKYIDHNTFIDFFFMQEISKSIDAFRRSAYLYKDKNSVGGKIKAGPLWDFNSAMYNAALCDFEKDTGWAYKSVCWINSAYHVPFWWGRLLQDSNYTRDLKCRWMLLRSTTLDTTHIFKIIDSIKTYVSAASVRHFTRFDLNTNIQIECDTLKWWLKKRLAWLDSKMPGLCTTTALNEKEVFENSLHVYPNPTAGQLTLDFYLYSEKKMKIELQDVFGRTLRDQPSVFYGSGKNKVDLDLRNLSDGIYFLKISDSEMRFTKKIVLEK